MKQLKQVINKVVEWVSIGLVVVMVLLVLWQIVARYLLNSPSSFSEALTRYLFVWLVLITSTYAFGSRDHMYIAALNDKLTGRTKTVVNILIEVLTILFAACVMVYGGSIITRMQMVSLDSSLHLPMGVVYGVIPVCGVLIVFYCIMVSMNLCIGTITPPVGSILFTGCKVGHVKIEQVIKELLPYFFAIIVALLLVTYIPAISMTLPTLAGLIK